MITFLRALPILAIILALIYVVLLLLSKEEREERRIKKDIKVLVLTSSLPFTLSIIGACLTLLTDFRETISYYALLVVLTALIVMAALNAHSPKLRAILAFSTIMWYIMIWYDQIPSTWMVLRETDHMVRDMLREGRWEFSMAHNPSYNPFSFNHFIVATLSQITSLPWYNWSLVNTFNFAVLVTYVLIIYEITRHITDSHTAALLAALLVGITPETNILMHRPQWSGNLLVMITILSLIKIIGGGGNKPWIICINITFTSAIFTHATATLGISVPLILLLLVYISSFLSKLGHRNAYSFPIASKKPLLISIIMSLIVIAGARAIHTYGYMKYVMPIARAFIIDIFFPKLEVGQKFIPLYERVRVSPLQAYSWVFVVATATALMVTEVIRKKVDSWHFTLYISAAASILIGYLIGTTSEMPPSTAAYRGVYTTIPFMIPMSALALARTLRSKKPIIIASLLLIAISAPIAAHDPDVSPREWAYARGFKCRLLPGLVFADTTPASLMEAYNVVPMLPSAGKMAVKSTLLEIGGGGISGYWKPEYSNEMIESLKVVSYIHKLSLPSLVTFLDEEEYKGYDVVYSSSRSMIYYQQ